MTRTPPSRLVALLPLAVSPVSLAAQETGVENDGTFLGTLVVEGELQSRDIQDTTTSVTVITGEELDQSDDKDLYTVIERTPNVTAGFGEKGFGIRGIDQRGPGAAGTGLLINTTVDGASLPNNQATFFGPFSTWDLQQIEVLRGPQSTQQGRNALGGAIVIRSADPVFGNENKLRAEYGERNTRGGAFAVNRELVEGKLALRFSGERLETDGWVDNPTLGTDSFDARSQETYRAKLRFDPSDDLSFILSHSYTDSSGGEDFVEADRFPGERVNLSNVPSEESLKTNITGLRAEWQINDVVTLDSETTYYTNDYSRLEDIDQSPADSGLLSRTGDAESVEQEFRLSFDAGAWTGVVGLFYTDIDDRFADDTRIDANSLDPGLVPAPGLVTITQAGTNRTRTENFAVFGEAEYAVTPRLGLIFGGRYDYEEQDFSSTTVTSSNVPLPPGTLPPDQTVRTSTSFDAFLPKVGAVYDWTPDVSTFATIQRGYRAGGSQQNTLTGEVTEFDPEFTWNYEIGLRSLLLDGRLTANANIFYTRWDDQQVNVQGPSGLAIDFTTVNAGESELYGGELVLEYRPTPNWDLFATVGYTETEFLDFIDGGEDLSGNAFPNAPEWTAAAGASYFFDTGWEAHTDVSFTDDSFSFADNNPATASDSRFLVNGRVGYRQGNWAVFAYVRNLFDEDFVTQSTESGAGRVGLNTAKVRTGEPRTVGVFATATF